MSDTEISIIACTSCKTKYKVAKSTLGNKVTCKKCNTAFVAKAANGASDYPIIGKLALQYKFISEEQLKGAIEIQKAQKIAGLDTPLEEILISKGLISNKMMDLLHSAVEFWEIRNLDKRFGSITIMNKFASQVEVTKALNVQMDEFKKKKMSRLLGDILVETGAITEEQRKMVMKKQKRETLAVNNKQAETDEESGQENEGDDTPEDGFGLEKLQLEIDGDISLFHSKDKTKAFIQPTGDCPELIDLEDIYDFLELAGIKYGIVDAELINEYLKKDILTKTLFQAAQGREPVNGQDAYIKYYFDHEPKKVGTITEDGAIDFMDRGEIPFAEAGDLLAEKIEATPGEQGVDVFGDPIPVPDTRDITLRAEKGTEISENGLKIVAAITGEPMAAFGGKFSVSSAINIAGDIGFKTGHVEFEGNIEVKGSVQYGFRVKGVTLQAQEILGAEIETTGDITVKGGIIGATIKTKGSVTATYIKNARIEAYGDIMAESEILDSYIATSGICLVKKGKLISSFVVAKKGIMALDIGTDVSEGCTLKPGHEDHISKVMSKLNAEIKVGKEELEEAESKLKAIETEQILTHKRIAELAKNQDRALAGQRGVVDKIEEFKKADDPKSTHRALLTLKELDSKVKEADAEISKLFEQQNDFVNNAILARKAAEVIEDRVEELVDEKLDLSEWTSKEKSTPIIRVEGVIQGGTKIMGTQASKVLDREYKAVRIKEVKVAQPDTTYKWDVRVFSLNES